jgi:hypothetical protein
MKRSIKLFITAIAAVGVIRFVLSVSGYPNEFVRYVSMTVTILAGTIYFGVQSPTHKGRLTTAYLLVLPYMIIEVSALAYTWRTGHQTIFHANEYSMGYPVGEHAIGHLVGGLTWEPLAIFVVMEIIHLIYSTLGRALGKMSTPQGTLRGE